LEWKVTPTEISVPSALHNVPKDSYYVVLTKENSEKCMYVVEAGYYESVVELTSWQIH